MKTRLVRETDNLWEAGKADGLSQLESLAYRSNLLGKDRSVANWGGGNTSAKAKERDHTGREIDVLWVKGSGSDLATITPDKFTGLKLAEVFPLLEREEMPDAEMVAYLARCQLRPEMPRGSIETLLHAFLPFEHVDHTHPDAINMICCAEDGEALARECFGDEAVWVPYVRPGFALSRQIALSLRENEAAQMVLLAKHGLITWGATAEECYASTVEAVNRAAEFVAKKSGRAAPFGGRSVEPLPEDRRHALLAEVLPTLRGAVSGKTHKILLVDDSEPVMEAACGADSSEVSQVGAACPDHLVHTKVRPLFVDFDPATEGAGELKERLVSGLETYREEYEAYFLRNRARSSDGDAPMADPNPRVVLIPGVGMVTVGNNHKAAGLSRDLYHRAIAVMRGASSIDSFVSLTEEESFAVEYWPLEQYKLSLSPPPKELEGKVALVTGGAGGIGGAVARSLAGKGACVVVADLDEEGSREVTAELPAPGLPVRLDVTDERQVKEAYAKAVLAYGGVDVVVSNAGLASSAAIEDTTLQLWNKNHAVLTTGYFLVSREAFRTLKEQGTGGSIVFVASKNALAAGKNASAYSSAKAAELHLARCLAEEGGASRIRVNTVNPDAVLRGSKIWSSEWREERAKGYGVTPDGLEEHYRQRNTLKTDVLPDHVAEAVLHFASEARSSRSTGNVLNVDGGVKEAYPR